MDGQVGCEEKLLGLFHADIVQVSKYGALGSLFKYPVQIVEVHGKLFFDT